MPTSPSADDVASPAIRVAIVDDHVVLADSLRQVLSRHDDIDCVGTAQSVSEARGLVDALLPDVLLLDQGLPDGDGVSAIPDLLRVHPRMRVVVLTASSSDQVMVRAVEGGAAGFVSKSSGVGEVTAAVRAAAAGEAVISAKMLARLLPRLTGAPRPAGAHETLTDREQEVLVLLAEGLTNLAIAQRLVVSVHTVRNHVANLSAKLGAHSKLEVLSIAVHEGLLPVR